ncbi:unnamed protein product [Leptidea sinapis]|uniref:EF-hand domain-containing protein n=1 Tax=Leptidea sinapis TaxID=189913 RepID=A0A5E4R283_9NEOP|nr:unnamed protein product [Leptidea sinapis]
MNPDEIHEDIEGEAEPEPESSEFEVCARLVLTTTQKNDLREAFNLLDYSGDGKIKAEDFRVAIKALGVDKGQTGKLSFENFEAAIMRKIMSLDSDGDIMKSFRLFDMDDCGFISAENLKKVTEILGITLSDEEIEEMIDDADKDYDGYVRISVQEFMRLIKNSVEIVTP